MAPGLLLICLAAVSWGTTGATMTVLARLADASPLLVGAARLAVAAPLLLAVARLAEGPLGAAPPRAAVVAGLCMAAYQVCYFTAVPRSGVALTALVAICSSPLIIAALAVAFLGERLTARTAIALAAGVAGTALLVLGPRGPGELTARLLGGVLLALGAGFSYALYAVVTKRGLGHSPPLALAAVTFSIAALALAPVLLVATAPPAGPVPAGAVTPVTASLADQVRRGWPLLLYLGAVPTALAYALYTTGLRRVPAVAAGIASLLEPLTATVLGVAAFGETLGARGALGASLLLGALVVLALPVRVSRPGPGA
jgi:drug/metabolite transporter, DME family